ncbi:cupin domain-containing protein [Lentibacillus sp. CBA3610]|nr:cupin domain-containing protein [Lentibacillus sp. CBA3610]
MGNVSLLAHVKVPPHSNIGFHQHCKEAETYYVLSGAGYFINNDKERIPVKPGDVCQIDFGQGHGLDNPNEEEMEIIAVVYPERVTETE